ncbi:uncharacterized protein LOC126981609 isoform X2 [Eriocheir sinensis]|nr:uncharacterized protein LOC126981609 isoform X2 [Eriocheir sinensis]
MVGLAAAVSSQPTGGNSGVGTSTDTLFRKEVKGSDGITRGEYGYHTPDGCLHVVSYETHPGKGYRVLGSSKKECGRPVTTKPSAARPQTTAESDITHSKTSSITIQTTTTRTPVTTRFTTSRRDIGTTIPATTPFTITNTKPRDSFLAPTIPPVDTNIVTEAVMKTQDSQGKQLQPTPTFIESDGDDSSTLPAYTFGYTTPTHGHTESGLPDGSKKGEYYWDGPDGWRRIVTYEANERGFFPRMRQVRIPTTTTTTVPPPTTTSTINSPPEALAKELLGNLPPQAGGCPYYFYYNTRINYHWERCFENFTKTGEFGQLGPDGYAHKTEYVADITGFHPRLTKTPLTTGQENVVAEYTEGAFIVPKPDEERRETEKRILAWLADNRNRIEEPLR